MIRVMRCCAFGVALAVSAGWADGVCLLDRVVEGEARSPVSVTTNRAGNLLFDFGLHQVGWLEVKAVAKGPYDFVWGELLDTNGSVQTNAFYTETEGNVRCACTCGTFRAPGWQRIPYRPGENATVLYTNTVDRFGPVMPFRWLEVVRAPFAVTAEHVRQVPLYYPYDMSEESFDGDSPELVRVHDFCKHTIRATSYTGKFIDGDRERIAYEGDSYITLLSTMAMTSDHTLSRASVDYLATHTTWPTEWKQFFIRLLYEDWRHTGLTNLVAKHYDLMKNVKSWRHLRRADGLIVTPGERMVPSPDGGTHQDIVDWGHGYRDGFVFRPVNAVVNALHYRNLREMAELARAIGKDDDALMFDREAVETYDAYQKVLFSPATGHYRDGEGTDHETVQANAMALSCGLVPEGRIRSVADYVAFKGFRCGTYMAQFVLDALFVAGRADAALGLMTSSAHRSWLGMMAKGATTTMEFWDLTWSEPWRVPDMNHAWSTSPLNVISRRVLGVTPLEPGFARVAISPQPGFLKRLAGVVPTVRGGVRVELTRNGDSWDVVIDSPTPGEFAFEGDRRSFTAGRRSFRILAGEHDEMTWPLVSREMKPWVCNRWTGGAVDETSIEHLCRELDEKGFGGIHVIPSDAAKGGGGMSGEVLSEKWIDGWKFAARRVREHDLGIDFTTESGCRFGDGSLDVLDSKFASSAAHVRGTNLVHAVARTGIDENICEAPSEIKAILDRLFLAGVNHVSYHGCGYSRFNAYVTRCQSFFQTWTPDDGSAHPCQSRKMPFDGLTGLRATRWRQDGKTAFFVVNTGTVARVISAEQPFWTLDPLDGSREKKTTCRLKGGCSAFVFGTTFGVSPDRSQSLRAD